MQIRKLLEIDKVIHDNDGRAFPCDLQDFNDDSLKYFSESKQEYINILDMELVHLLRIVKKTLYRQNYDRLAPKYRTYNVGHEMVFEKIPNDDFGKQFIKLLKIYLNNEGYKMRVKGQNVKEEFKKTGCTYHGQPISKSKNLRVYLDRKTTTEQITG